MTNQNFNNEEEQIAAFIDYLENEQGVDLKKLFGQQQMEYVPPELADLRSKMPTLQHMIEYLALEKRDIKGSKKDEVQKYKNHVLMTIDYLVSNGLNFTDSFDKAMDSVYHSYRVRKVMNENKDIIKILNIIEAKYKDNPIKKEKAIDILIESLLTIQTRGLDDALDTYVKFIALENNMVLESIEETLKGE